MNETLLQAALRAREAGDLLEAARLCTEVLHAHPRHFQALYLMGVLHCETSEFEHAQRLLGEAVSLNPRSPEALYMRGCALKELNRISEALFCFDEAAAIRPTFIEAHINRAAALMTLRRNEQALQAIGKALTLDPENAGAWNNRGCILRELDRLNDAAAAFEKAVALQPDFAAALTNYGSVLAQLKRYEDAAALYEEALAVAPELPYGRGTLALYRLSACDWRHLEKDQADIAAGVKAGKRIVYPFDNLLLSLSMADQLAAARIWVANDAPMAPAPLWRGDRYTHSKIRVAYVSADFHAHATAMLLVGVLEHHDRNRFEIIGVSLGRNDQSELRARVAGACDRFFDVAEKSTVGIAALLREIEVDIAVDLKGYTEHHRPGLFGFRAAPI